MSGQAHDVGEMVNIYKKLFLFLAIVTALGICVAYFNLPVLVAVGIAFVIMLLKGKIVLDSFKGLLVGKNALIILFGLTIFFFITVLLLPLFNHSNQITDAQDISKELQLEEKPVEAHHGH